MSLVHTYSLTPLAALHVSSEQVAAPRTHPPARPPARPPAGVRSVPAAVDPSAQILLNKIALSQFDFSSANALLLFQCLLCVVAVQVCSSAGLVKTEPFSMRVVRVW